MYLWVCVCEERLIVGNTEKGQFYRKSCMHDHYASLTSISRFKQIGTKIVRKI